MVTSLGRSKPPLPISLQIQLDTMTYFTSKSDHCNCVAFTHQVQKEVKWLHWPMVEGKPFDFSSASIYCVLWCGTERNGDTHLGTSSCRMVFSSVFVLLEQPL